MSDDVRKHPRVRPDAKLPVRVDIMGNGFLEVLPARDISVGGLSVFVPHGFDGYDTNSEVELILTLGRERPFKTRAVIRHRSRGDANQFFGLEFVGLSAEHRVAIEAYVSRCLAVSKAKF